VSRLFAGTPWDRPSACDRCGRLESQCLSPPPVPDAKQIPPRQQTARLMTERRANTSEAGHPVSPPRSFNMPPWLGVWSNAPAALSAELKTAIGPKASASARWPKRTGRFTSELRRIAPQLRMHGLHITLGRTRSARFIALEPAGQS
jgi:hypothetical protein